MERDDLEVLRRNARQHHLRLGPEAEAGLVSGLPQHNAACRVQRTQLRQGTGHE